MEVQAIQGPCEGARRRFASSQRVKANYPQKGFQQTDPTLPEHLVECVLELTLANLCSPCDGRGCFPPALLVRIPIPRYLLELEAAVCGRTGSGRDIKPSWRLCACAICFEKNEQPKFYNILTSPQKPWAQGSSKIRDAILLCRSPQFARKGNGNETHLVVCIFVGHRFCNGSKRTILVDYNLVV